MATIIYPLSPSLSLFLTKPIQNANLDRTQLSLCVSLIENGVNPEALANAITELRREASEVQLQNQNQQDSTVSE